MEIAATTALVTGANRGLGRHLAGQLRDRGATVYAGARNPASVNLPGERTREDGLDGTCPTVPESAAIGGMGTSGQDGSKAEWPLPY